MQSKTCESDSRQSDRFTSTDVQWMERVQEKDSTALAAIYQRYIRPVRAAIASVVANASDTDELADDVFIALWNAPEKFDRTKGTLLGWLITMARRRGIDRVRRRLAYSRVEERVRLEPLPGSQSSSTRGTNDESCDVDRAGVFQRIFARLPEAQRVALHLSCYGGMTHREIARKTGTPIGTVKTRLELAVRKVRAAVVAIGDRDAWLAQD